MAGMTRFCAWLASGSCLHESVALFPGRIRGWRPAGVGRVLVQSGRKSVQPLEEGAHHKTHPQGRLLPILSGDVESLWKEIGGASAGKCWEWDQQRHKTR